MTDLNAQYFALRERFISRLPERMARMKRCLAELSEGHPEARTALHREAHSLVGAAGLHQLDGLAQAARDLEQLAEHAHTAEIAQALSLLQVQLRHPEGQPTPKAESLARLACIALLCQDEDELASQKTLLESAGHSVQAVTHPDDFRRLLREGLQADLIVLGLQFDGDDQIGLELLNQLSSSSPSTPVIVFSASHAMPTQLAAYMKGATAFIVKPVAADALLDSVSAALLKFSNASLKVLALGDTRGLTELTQVSESAGIELVGKSDIHSFLECLADDTIDGIILLEPCPAPGIQKLSALINGQALDRRMPLVVIKPDQLAEGSADWLQDLVRRKLAEHGAVRDLVKRYKTQHYEHERQKLALDHHTIISIADKTGTVIETSNRMSELLGWPRTSLIGSHLWENHPHQPPAEFDTQKVKHAVENGIWQGEVALKNQEGQPLWFQSTLIPFFAPEGFPYRYMVIRSDITQQKLAEQALESSKAKETDLAVKMQAALLVPPLPGCVGNVPVASYFSAASGMGGDFHALTEHAPGCFDLLIGDVMGKGLHAAIVGAAVKLEFNRCLLDLKRTEALPSPAKIVQALDERLRTKLQAFECFVTLAYLRCDLDNSSITHVGCGHPESLLIEDHRVSRLSNHHPPLGIVPLTASDQTVTAWPPGASIFMYTDGLPETMDNEGRALGDEALVDALIRRSATAHRHPLSMAAAALEAASQHQDNNLQMDDWTLIALRRPVKNERHLELPGQLSSLSALRQAVREVALQTEDVSLCDRAELVASEIFSNIVRHGIDALDRPGSIHVGLLGGADTVGLSFHYRGIPFEPVGEQALPAPEMLTEGGLGLPLIFSLSTSVCYEHTHGLCSCSIRLSTDQCTGGDVAG